MDYSTGLVTANFITTGNGTGSYPGAFSETATYTFVGPNGPTTPGAFGHVTAFHATFTITSAAGTVTGTKDLPEVAVTGFGFCGDVRLGVPPVGEITGPPFIYQASITTPTGSATDGGSGTLSSADLLLNKVQKIAKTGAGLSMATRIKANVSPPTTGTKEPMTAGHRNKADPWERQGGRAQPATSTTILVVEHLAR